MKSDFYKKVAFLVIPIALQNLINVGITMTDVIMLGKVNETVVSASNVAGQIQFIMMMVFFGITSGVGVLSAQYWGKGNIDAIEKILGMALKIALIFTLIFTCIVYLIPDRLMHIYIEDPEVISEGVDYLRIVALSYIMIAVTMTYLNTMRSIERVLISTVVYMSSLIINIVLDYALIFGKLGLPNMGIKGAALATLIARICEIGIVLIYNFIINKDIKIRLKYLLTIDKNLLKDFMKISVPVVANELMWGLGTSANTGILGNYDFNGVSPRAVIAASTAVQVTRQLATVVSFGFASAAAVIVGKSIGEKRMQEAKVYARRMIILTIAAGVAGAILVLFARPFAMDFLEISDEAKGYLSTMMYVMSYFVIAQAANTVLVVGIFRAGGDTVFGLILDISTMWFCSIMIGWIAAFVLKLPIMIVYVILMSDEVIKVPICFWRYKKKKWLNDITRDGI